MLAPPLALSTGAWIFLGIVALLLAVIVFVYYTRAGSGIDQAPYGDLDGPTGPEHPGDLAPDGSEKPSRRSGGDR
jgi:hypothetical protein